VIDAMDCLDELSELAVTLTGFALRYEALPVWPESVDEDA
jgi:hypothetical protein